MSSTSGTLTVVVDIEMNSLDPNNLVAGAARRVACNISPGLVRLSEDWSIQPALADEWETRDGGQTVVVRLVRDARFHSGRAVTAEAVVENFDRICAPDSQSFQRSDYEVIASLTALDQSTVRFELREPYSPFLGLLANATGMTDVRSIATRDPRTSPVGAGPYELVRWASGDHLELRAFSDYHLAKVPRVAEVYWRFVPDAVARANALRQDEAQLGWGLPCAEVANLRPLGVVVDVAEGHGPTHLAFNCVDPPFSDHRVRLAVAHAVNRERLVQTLFGGLGTVSTTPFPPSSPWYAGLSGPLYDPERARSLLAAAGLGGKRLRLDLPVNGSAGAHMGGAVAEDLTKVGIDLNVIPYDNPVWWPGIYTAGNWQMILQTWTPMPDPDQVMGRRYHSRGIFNTGRYASPAMDSLLERGRRTVDLSERKAIYRAAQELAIRNVPTVYLFHEPAITGWSPAVKGFRPHPSWEMYVETVSFAEADGGDSHQR